MAKNTDSPENGEFRFNLGEAYKYNRFPMKRLSEYLREIIQLFGEDELVYFIRLEKGSAVAVVATEPEHVPAVRENLQAVVRGFAPADRIAAFRRLQNLRDEDHALKAVPVPDEASNIIEFPAREPSEETFDLAEPDFGWVDRFESVQGVPIQVGDEKERRKVVLKARDGRIHKFETTDEIANEIAHHIFEKTRTIFRAEGTAQWRRLANGEWKQRNFSVSHISVVPDTSLTEDLDTLRAYPAKWKEREDPLRDLDIIRHEDDIQ